MREVTITSEQIEQVISRVSVLDAFAIKSLFDQGRLSKGGYIQLAIALEFGVHSPPKFEDQDHANEFAEKWSIDAKGKKVKRSDLWAAISKYIKQYDDDDREDGFPLLEYLDGIADDHAQEEA